MSDKVKKVFIVIFVVIIIGLFSINLLLQEISINKKYDMAYKEAKELYDRKQYKKSLKTIKNKCKSFKNCDENKAKELFEKLGDYKDSKKYMLKIMNCWFEILKD